MIREEHGDYWFVIDQVAAGPSFVWEWKVYKELGGRIAARQRANSEDEACQAARWWIEHHKSARPS